MPIETQIQSRPSGRRGIRQRPGQQQDDERQGRNADAGAGQVEQGGDPFGLALASQAERDEDRYPVGEDEREGGDDVKKDDGRKSPIGPRPSAGPCRRGF